MQEQGEILEEAKPKSTFEQTIQALDTRANFFRECHLSNESVLIEKTHMGERNNLRSACDIMVNLGNFSFCESPVQPALRDLYTSQYDKTAPRCVLPPPSDGERSISENQSFEPSCHWLSKVIIDSTLLQVDQVESIRADFASKNKEWEGIKELLIHNVSKKIHEKEEVKLIANYFYRFEKNYKVKVKKIREIYYKGKPSVLIRFADQFSCAYVYEALLKREGLRKEELGTNNQVYRVIQNRLSKTVEHKWVGVLIRNLPSQLSKQGLIEILQKRNLMPLWAEDLITIQNFKYTLCKIGNLDEAFALCSYFQLTPPFKEIKVNLHPKSAKVWKSDVHQLL